MFMAGDFDLDKHELAKFIQLHHQQLKLIAANKATFTSAESESNIDYFTVTSSFANFAGAQPTIDLEVGLHPHSAVCMKLNRVAVETKVLVWDRPKVVAAKSPCFGPQIPDGFMNEEWQDISIRSA